MKLILLILSTLCLFFTNQAYSFEITPYIGYSYSDNIDSTVSNNKLMVSNNNSYGLAFAWQNGSDGQGMILVNSSKHNFHSDLDNKTHSLNIVYAHFNGVAQFRQQNYITTFSIGLGGAYFKRDKNSNLYPSLTVAFGTRYQLSKNMAFVTELRGYATLTKNKDNLFCQNSSCSAQFSNATWIDSNVSMGITYKF